MLKIAIKDMLGECVIKHPKGDEYRNKIIRDDDCFALMHDPKAAACRDCSMVVDFGGKEYRMNELCKLCSERLVSTPVPQQPTPAAPVVKVEHPQPAKEIKEESPEIAGEATDTDEPSDFEETETPEAAAPDEPKTEMENDMAKAKPKKTVKAPAPKAVKTAPAKTETKAPAKKAVKIAPAASKANPQAVTGPTNKDKAVAFLKSGITLQTELVKAMNASTPYVSKLLKDLVTAGKVKVTEKDGKKFYTAK